MKADERQAMLARVQDLLKNDLVYKLGPAKGQTQHDFMTKVYDTALQGVRAESAMAAEAAPAATKKKGK